MKQWDRRKRIKMGNCKVSQKHSLIQQNQESRLPSLYDKGQFTDLPCLIPQDSGNDDPTYLCKLGSWTQFNAFVWRLPYTNKQCLDSSWCPRHQPNPDTIYLETESDYTGKGFSVTRLLSNSDASHKPRLPVILNNWQQMGNSNNLLQLKMPIPSPGCYLCFWPAGYVSVPTILSVDSINLLKQLTEPRKPIYSLHYRFVTKDIKGYKSTARWRET